MEIVDFILMCQKVRLSYKLPEEMVIDWFKALEPTELRIKPVSFVKPNVYRTTVNDRLVIISGPNGKSWRNSWVPIKARIAITSVSERETSLNMEIRPLGKRGFYYLIAAISLVLPGIALSLYREQTLSLHHWGRTALLLYVFPVQSFGYEVWMLLRTLDDKLAALQAK